MRMQLAPIQRKQQLMSNAHNACPHGQFSTDAVQGCLPSSSLCVQDIKHWLHWLKYDVGFGGLRFDFAKGYGANWVKEYVEATRPHLAIGEVWTDCKWNGTLLDYDQARSTASPAQRLCCLLSLHEWGSSASLTQPYVFPTQLMEAQVSTGLSVSCQESSSAERADAQQAAAAPAMVPCMQSGCPAPSSSGSPILQAGR